MIARLPFMGVDITTGKISAIEGVPDGMRLVRDDGGEVKAGDIIGAGERIALRDASITGPLAPEPEPVDAAESAEQAPLTEAELAEIEAIASGATAGPWRSTWGDDKPPGETVEDDIAVEAVGRAGIERIVVGALWYDGPNSACRAEDAAFIASARSDVPRLIADLRRAQKRIADLEAQICQAIDDGEMSLNSERRGLLNKRAAAKGWAEG